MQRLIALLFLAAVSVAQQPSAANAPELTIQAIYAEGGISGRLPENIEWSPDANKVSYILRDEQGENPQLYVIDAATGKPAVLVASEKLASLAPPVTRIKDERERERRTRYSVAGYHWAPDSQHILFDANGKLWLYALENGTATSLDLGNTPADDPKFSPDGKKLSYLRNHNLLVRPVSGGEENTLTHDKDENLLNGEVDWVYAEELDVRSNYFWSPNGSKIVFLQMDESKVPKYPIVDFLPLHPSVSEQKYPKVGDPNPEVKIGVIKTSGGGLRWIKLTSEKDIYIPRFGWVNDSVVWAMVLNRAQNQLDLYFADANNGKSRRVLSETSDTWIEMDNSFSILAGGRFIWPSWRDGHTHLYLYSFDKDNPLAADAKLENQITKGDFEVSGIEAIEESSGTVYLTANPRDDRQRHLCSVKLDGSNFQVLTEAQPGTHETNFAPNAKYYVDNFSALVMPPVLSFCRVGGGCTAFWQSKPIEAFKLAAPEFVDFHAEDGTVLRGLLYLPPAGAGNKIPVLMNPYGGPHGQVVRNQWNAAGLLFNEILMRDGIAILQVDNRGMGQRGKKFAAALMHNFGEIELKDQLTALDQALEKFPQLDRNRLGWWGWSYGGYMTLYALTHSDRFKAGLAVAPVTDWHDYDTIYTERYGGLLPENEAAYKKSAPVNFAQNLHGRLLEVHGTSDDNVHMQNTIQMINNLVRAGKQYELMLYPNKTHSISGPVARTHLFTRIREYFHQELLQGGNEP